ncbi:nucleotide exchange factor GrpE [Microbacterium sp. E-13]|uniref:nucleotide exchange factor GrpE n=1 Tax=Microbacterium sp. E-13 TaxID=3404048 RepID=UPI003CF39301
MDEAPAEAGAGGEDETAQQIAELQDSWRRTAAELDNFRKRSVKDVIRAREQERASVASRWLPVVDNLERALEHASSDSDVIAEGVRAVHQQALAVLADLGFPRRDDETGKPFNPAHHDAVGTVADPDLVPGTVAHVVRPGYGADGEILRPASVIVATRSE